MDMDGAFQPKIRQPLSREPHLAGPGADPERRGHEPIGVDLQEKRRLPEIAPL
jgi:hypothetical protein